MILEEVTAVSVEVFNPETPFGGVQVFGAAEEPVQIEINTGSPVQSVFGRIGHINALFQDYDQFYAPLAAAVPPGGLNGQVLTKDSNQSYDLKWGSPTGEGGLPSGGTTGQILAKIDNQPFNAAWVTALYAPLGSELPTGGTANQILAKVDSTNYNAAWVTPVLVTGFEGRTGNVTALATDYDQFYQPLGSYEPALGNPSVNGYILSSTTAGVRSWIAPAAGGVTSVFTRTGAVVAAVGDYAAFYQPLDSDLTAISALTTTAFGRGFLPLADAAAARTYIGAGTSNFTQANADALYAPIAHTHTFASLTSKPTTLSGYGITDAQPLDSDLTSIAALTTTAYGRGFLPLADAAAARTYIGAQVAGSYLTANQPISLTGDITGGPAATSIATTYNNAVPMAKAGVPTGGTAGQVLSKIDATNYNLAWINPVTGGGGDVFGPAASVDNELTLFSGTTGKTIKRATTTGILKATSGVIAAAVAGTDYQAADADLTSLAGATGTNTIYYRSAADTWSPVTMGPSMAFSGGVLDAAVGAPNDGAFGIDWNGMTAVPPSSNAVYDALHRFDTDDDGKINVLDTVAGLVKTDLNGIVSNAVAGTDYEASLGNPSTNGYVLSSTTAGVRSWIASAAGGIGGSTGATDNRILRADGTGGATLQTSGVTINDAGQIIMPNTGIIYSDSAAGGFMGIYSNGTSMDLIITPTRISLRSGQPVIWTSSATDASGTADTGLKRNAAGVVEVNNGTAGQYRDLFARNITAQTGGAIVGNGSVPSGGALGYVLKKLSATSYDVDWQPESGGGVSNFLALTDTPDAYTGHGGKVVAVNSGATGLEFIAAGGGGSFNPAIDNLFTAAQSLTLAPAANTVANGWLLADTTAATSGNQQYSPSIQLTGRGFGGSTSQAVDWRIYNLPRQGATNPTSKLMIDYQTNAGGWNNLAFFDSSPFVYGGGIRQGLCYPNSTGMSGIHWIAEDAGISMYTGGIAFLWGSTTYAAIFPQSFRTVANGLFTWSNSNFDPIPVDTALTRNATGIVEVNNGTAGQYRDLYARNITLQSSGIITGLGTVPTGGTAGQVLRKVSATNYDLEWGTGGGGVSDFLALTDTPDSYAGQGGKLVAVNSGGTALEFVVAGGGGNVSSSGTPTNLQYARWTDATHISGVAASTVKTDLALVASDVGLGNVTNNAQTQAAIVPNTVPTSGQILIGNAGGTAYAKNSISGNGATISLSSVGVLSISGIVNASLTNPSMTIAGVVTALGGTLTQDQITGLSGTGLIKRTGANALATAVAETDYVTPTGTGTLTNKRVTPRVFSVASSATPTFSSDSFDCADITALAVNITSMSSGLTGTPSNFDKLTYRIKDNGTARTIAWGASFESSMAVLPLSTVAGKTMTVGFLRNTTSAKWECVAVDIEDAAFASLQTAEIAASVTGITAKMLGFGAAGAVITPRVSGKVFIQITCGVFYTAGGTYFSLVDMQYGTGAAPANGAAVAGTKIGNRNQTQTGPSAVITGVWTALLTGLVVGTTYWIDLSATGSNAAAQTICNNPVVTAYEMP